MDRVHKENGTFLCDRTLVRFVTLWENFDADALCGKNPFRSRLAPSNYESKSPFLYKSSNCSRFVLINSPNDAVLQFQYRKIAEYCYAR